MRSGVLKPDHRIYKAIERLRTSLRSETPWYPYPFMVSLFLVVLLMAKVLPPLNPRLGHQAESITLEAPPEGEGSMWLSITIAEGRVVITTSDRSVFSWANAGPTAAEREALQDHLRATVHERIFAATLKKTAEVANSFVSIAVDQRVTFAHLRPILYCLAAVGVANYGFETILPAKTDQDPLHVTMKVPTTGKPEAHQ